MELTIKNLRKQVGYLAHYLRKNDKFETEFELHDTYIELFIIRKNSNEIGKTMFHLMLNDSNHVNLSFEYMEKDYRLSADILRMNAFIDSKETAPEIVWNTLQEMVDHYSCY